MLSSYHRPAPWIVYAETVFWKVGQAIAWLEEAEPGESRDGCMGKRQKVMRPRKREELWRWKRRAGETHKKNDLAFFSVPV